MGSHADWKNPIQTFWIFFIGHLSILPIKLPMGKEDIEIASGTKPQHSLY
jgi:hypothetical protein